MSALFDIETGDIPDDPALTAVEAELYRLDPTGDRVAAVLRDTLDQLYDEQHTGRWSFDQLHKTEKTHMGTLIEINLHREFDFEDGEDVDYQIAGVDVDCKYSMKMGGWNMPPEVIGHLALLVWADDQTSMWKAGLVRVTEEGLNLGRNRDRKGTLSKVGRRRIRWLWASHGRLAPNLFLQLDPVTRNRIFGAEAKRATATARRVPMSCSVVSGEGSSGERNWLPLHNKTTS